MIGIDWGTTALRGYLIENDQLVEHRELPYGVLKVPKDGFKDIFDKLIDSWSGTVLLSGMVGSSKGWLNTPYVQTPFSLTSLQDHLIDFSHLTQRPSWLVPGVQQSNPADVMRGEELQSLGAACLNGKEHLILCGTHSKHVELEDGKLISFSTYMTGELYAILQTHSILAEPHHNDEDLFVEGVQASLKDENLLNQMFQIRAMRLNGSLNKATPYLSGLLIGTELKGLKKSKSCTVVGSKSLSKLYLLAIRTISPQTQVNLLSAEDASIKGYTKIFRSIHV